MTYIELQVAFEHEINKFYNGTEKPTSEETFYFLNAAKEKFITTRYTGFINSLGFEADQKRLDDLRTLVAVTELTEDNIEGNDYYYKLPTNYKFLLGDTVYIAPKNGLVDDCWKELDKNGNYAGKRTSTIEARVENVDEIINNSLSDYHFHNQSAKPIKLQANDYIELITDNYYKIYKYTITYLKQADKLQLPADPFTQYTDMPEHTHLEIVRIAAKMYIENIGTERINSYSNEVKEQE